jgi:hypothetical protein
MSFWQTIRSYVLWTHNRGSIHYDVMVTVILLFIFLTPLWVDFRDKPVGAHPASKQSSRYSSRTG